MGKRYMLCDHPSKGVFLAESFELPSRVRCSPSAASCSPWGPDGLRLEVGGWDCPNLSGNLLQWLVQRDVHNLHVRNSLQNLRLQLDHIWLGGKNNQGKNLPLLSLLHSPPTFVRAPSSTKSLNSSEPRCFYLGLSENVVHCIPIPPNNHFNR